MEKKTVLLGCLSILMIGAVATIAATSNFKTAVTAYSERYASVITYRFADDSSKGVVKTDSYTVTDKSNGKYYNGFVSDGEFSTNGLTLSKGEFFKADLTGAYSVNVEYSSGSFAIELSNTNETFSSRKYLNSGETYQFNATMRFIRVLSTNDDGGTLTKITIVSDCIADNYFLPGTTMSESVWTNTVKENKVTLVGNQKGSALDDFNYLSFYATRDDKGAYFYVDQRVSGDLYHSSDVNWWENNNFEFHVNNVATWGGFQLYGSTLDSNHTNFDIISVSEPYKVNSNYDLWWIINYKCYVSYETLSLLGGKEYNQSSNIYLWYASASGHGFDHCDSWEHDAAVKLTVNGIVDVNNVKYATDYEHNRGGWNDLFVEIDDSIQDKERSYLAIHSNAALTCNENSIADIVWRTTLLAMMNGDRTAGSVFRLDWYHFDHNFTPDAFENGSIWEYDAKTINDTYKYLEVVRDCDIVYTVSRDGNVYNMCTSIFPAKADLVGRGDYVLRQSVTTSTQLGAYIVCEWTNFTAFKK